MPTETNITPAQANEITSFIGDLLGAIFIGTIEDQTKK